MVACGEGCALIIVIYGLEIKLTVGSVDCSRIILLSCRDQYREKKGTHSPNKSELAPKEMLTKF